MALLSDSVIPLFVLLALLILLMSLFGFGVEDALFVWFEIDVDDVVGGPHGGDAGMSQISGANGDGGLFDVNTTEELSGGECDWIAFHNDIHGK